MPPLAVALSFPTGQFHAHDARGNAEWPPAPARVVMALLATAYSTGSQAHIDVARRLFELGLPTLHTPPAAERHIDFARWVPVDVAVNLTTGVAERGGLTGKMAKPPERGTAVNPDDTITLTWKEAQLSPTELAHLDDVLTQLFYLGRPTSPVVARRLPEGAVPAPGNTTWLPDDTGQHRLRIATPRLLNALDAREKERDELGITGHHPLLTTRSEACYRRIEPAQSGGRLTYRPATQAETADAAAGLMYYPTPGATPSDITSIANALATENDGSFILPVYGSTTRRGLNTDRLLGVATSGIPPRSVTYLRGRELTELPPARPGATGASALRAVASAWGTAAAWTTLVPVTADRDDLRRLINGLAAHHSADLVDATVHDVSRHPNGPNTTLHPHHTHLSLLFARPLRGSISLGSSALTPISQTDAK